MFSKAGLEDKRGKKVLSFLSKHIPESTGHLTGTRISGAFSKSMSWQPMCYPVPSPPPNGHCPTMRGQCRRQRGHKCCRSRLLGLLRTEKGNNDSALRKQLPVVLKLLQT